MAKAESLKEGIENLDNTNGFKLDESLFIGDKETVMKNIADYYENSTEETVSIIKNMQAFGEENMFNVLDVNSDGIVTEEELSDLANASLMEGSNNTIDTNFSLTDFHYYYNNAMAAKDAIVEKDENIIKITYKNENYTELKTDENGNVYSCYYNYGRKSVEYNTKDNSTTTTFIDSIHRPTKIIYDKEGKKSDSVTRFTYNDDGSKVVEVETIGKKIITQYDSNGNTISESSELKYNSDGIIDDTKQKDEGNCWALSGINALRATEKGAEIIKNSIHQNDDGSVTVYLNGVNKSYTYTPEDIACDKIYETGDDDMDILMMAISDFRSEKIVNRTGAEKQSNLEVYIGEDVTLDDPLKGGFPTEAIYYLTGIKSEIIAVAGEKPEKKAEILNEYLKADKSDIAATISFKEVDKSIDNNITTKHTYSIIGADDENVYVENPWNAGVAIAYPIDKIKDNISQISLTYLSDENKNTASNLEEKTADSSNEQESILEKIGNFLDKIGSGIKSFFKNLF